MTTTERELLIVGLARAVTGIAKLDSGQRQAIAAVVSVLPEACTLGDLVTLMKRRDGELLERVVLGLEPLAAARATAHLFRLPLAPAIVQEVEVEALLRHLEQRVAFDLECLERGIDPRPQGWA